MRLINNVRDDVMRGKQWFGQIRPFIYWKRHKSRGLVLESTVEVCVDAVWPVPKPRQPERLGMCPL
jgi:hypothetical protein